MTIEIKGLDSTDVDLNWWTPTLHEQVYFPVHLTIGETGEDEADLFQVLIATPEGLRKHGQGDVLSDRATLVFSDYSPKILRQTLERIVEPCAAETWQESVLRLQRFFSWEYEDYR